MQIDITRTDHPQPAIVKEAIKKLRRYAAVHESLHSSDLQGVSPFDAAIKYLERYHDILVDAYLQELRTGRV